MRKLSEFFVYNPKLTLVVTLFLLLWGILGLFKMNAESYPSVDFAVAIIETEYYGATPEDIEVKITKPIEDQIRTVSGLKDVRSTSQEGRSKIVVRVDMDNPKVIVKDVMADIQRAIDRSKNLPLDLKEKPKFTEIKSEEFAALELAVVGNNDNRFRDLVANALKEDFEDDKNVKEARLSGYREREFEIQLSRSKLDLYHIGVNEVLSKISARNTNTPGGELEDTGLRRLVKVDGKIHNATELGNVVIRENFSGQAVLLKDVATVIDGQETARTLNRYNGEEATLITIAKKSGADTLKLVSKVNPILKRYQEKYQGKLKFEVFNNEGTRVEAKLSTLKSNAISGLIVVIAVLLFFMPGRIGLMVAISLPISLLATLGLMPSFSYTLNSITILALIIAMGMLVDNSIVISEEYIRRRQLGEESHDAAINTVHNMWIPISATAFTTIAAFLPMLVTTGIMGRFISPIPVVVTFALLFCLLECFLLLPMRLHFIGKNMKFHNVEEKKKSWFDSVAKKFETFMAWSIENKYKTSLIMSGIILFSFLMIGVFNKFMLFPPEQTEFYVARIDLPQNTKVEVTHELVGKLEKAIHEKLGSKLVASTVGYAGSQLVRPDDVKGQSSDNVGLIRIMATDHAKYNVKGEEYLKLLREIKLESNAQISFEELINGPPVGAPVTVTFRSNNSESLSLFINKLSSEVKNIPGIFDFKVDDIFGPDEVLVDVNYNFADRLGLTAKQIGDTVRTALTGTFISDVTLNNKEAKLNVKFTDLSKKDTRDLGSLKIMDHHGNLVPLNLLARFKEQSGTPQIKRFDYKRAKTITANVDTKVITSVKANQKVLEIFNRLSKDHPDISFVFGGEQESTNESMKSLGNAMILALIGVYAIMVYIFRSFLSPGLIMTTIPMGLLGVSVAFFFHGRPVSFLSMIGVIGLAGIIVNNGIILIDFIEQMKAEGKMSLKDILIQAPTIRLKPVMATSLTTMGGLFPTAYGLGGSDAMLIPMTLAMAWGLTTGTILTLVWIPSGYAIIEDIVSFKWSRLNFFAKRNQNVEIVGK